MGSQNGNSSKANSIDFYSECNEANGTNDFAYQFPPEVWEKILMYVGCESWSNLAKAYNIVQGVISSIKKKEIEKCKRNLKRMPFEFYIELKEVSGSPKTNQKTRIIESYVNYWKFHHPDKVKLSQIPYSHVETPVPVDYMNVSGRWIILYTQNSFNMVHLDSLIQRTCPSPTRAVYVEKFVFLRSSEFGANRCQSCSDCWCNGDLGHDYLQVLLPKNMRIMQSGIKSISIRLHSFQLHDGVDKTLPGYFHVTSGMFRLSFSPYFGFDKESFASCTRNPEPRTYVFDGERGVVSTTKRLLDVSISPVPPTGDTFRAILLILDDTLQSYRLLFLEGPKIVLSLPIPPLLQASLYRGSVLIGLCPNGSVCFISHRATYTMKSSLLTESFTCLDLRGNLLAIGTRDGALLLYSLRGRPIDLPVEMQRTRGPKRLQVTNESICLLRFIPSSAGPELLFLTITHKLYHVKLAGA